MKKILLALIVFASLSVACNPFRDGVMKKLDAKGYNEKQKLALFYHGYRIYFAKRNDDGTYTPLYSRLKRSDIIKQLNSKQKMIESFYQDEESAAYVKQFGLVGYLQEQEKIIKTIYKRINLVELDSKFKRLTGSSYSYYDDMAEGYDPTIFAVKDIREKFKFDSQLIDEAKSNKTLKLIEHFTIEHSRALDRKEPDPTDLSDKNKFVWRERKYSLDVSKYKVIVDGTQPKDNSGDYVEIYRVVDGKKESIPTVRGFMLSGRVIAVIDADEEAGKSGFGIPDFVEELSEDQVLSNDLFAKLYPSNKKYLKTMPAQKPLFVEIVRSNSAKYSEWEAAPSSQGWTIPLAYKVEPGKLNFNVKFLLKDSSNYESVLIQYILKEYTKAGDRHQAAVGNVVEYFKSKAPFDKDITDAFVMEDENTRKISITTLDGEERTGVIPAGNNAFTQDRPYMIAYTLAGKRYLIRDENGDGIYEGRREVALPQTDNTGSYEEDPVSPGNLLFRTRKNKKQ